MDAHGHIYGGAEALVRLVNLGHPLWGKLLYPYYPSGIKSLGDRSYAWYQFGTYMVE